MIGYIIFGLGVITFSFGCLDQFFKIHARIDELEERWIFDDICSRY